MKRTSVLLPAILVFTAILLNVVYASRDLFDRPAPIQQSDWSAKPGPLTVHPALALKLGDFPVSSDAHFSVELRNETSDEISIIDLATSCGCTDVKVTAKLIAPGEATSVTGSIRGKKSAQSVAVSVKVNYQAGQQAYSEDIAVGANFVSEVSMQPMAVLLKPNPDSAEPYSSTAEVTNTSSRTLKLKLSNVLARRVKVEPDNFTLAESETKTIRLIAEADCESVSGSIVLSEELGGSTNCRCQSSRVQVSGHRGEA